MVPITDIERWKKNLSETPSWDERNQLMAAMVPANSSVLDVGAGSMTIQGYLPPGCSYQPVDCVKGCETTLIAEFNEGLIPVIDRKYDIAICSGVLEYIASPTEFLQTVAAWANKVLLSYAVFEYTPMIAKRRAGGWINDLNIVQMDQILFDAGLRYRIRAVWKGQLIYELQRLVETNLV